MQTNTAMDGVTYRYYVVLLLLFVLLGSCRKTVTQPSAELPKTDAKTIRLKQLLVEKMPSPYFYFTYSSDGFADSISFAAGFFTYRVNYRNNRVSSLVNTFDNRELAYQYNNARVSEIVETTAAHQELHRYALVYNAKNQLSEVTYWVIPSNGLKLVQERKVALQYHPDGNLSSLKDERYDLGDSEIVVSTTTEFSDYDNGINPDEFYLLKDTWGNLLYLPQVILQKNNPRLVVIIGKVNDYRIDYTYDYNSDHLPISKQLRMEQTRGQNIGQVIKSAHHFSYY